MKVLESHALQLGAKIGRPHIDEMYFPIGATKYITVNTQKIESKNYTYMQEAVDLIEPYLSAKGIKILHIGHKDDPQLSRVSDYRGRITSTQLSYVIRNSLLHLGADGFFNDIAAAQETSLVNLISTSPKDYCEPIWGSAPKVSLEGDRKGKSFSYSPQEKPKSIDSILPEEIADAVLNLIGESNFVLPKTLFIGDYYHAPTIEVVPDFRPHPNFLKGATINIRADYHMNEANIVYLCQGRAVNIVLDKPINLDYLRVVKDNVKMVNVEATDAIDVKFLKNLKKLGLNIFLFTKDEGRLKELQLKFLEWGLEYIERKTKKSLDIEDKVDNNTKYRSSKITISKEKQYSSKAAWLAGCEIGGDVNVIDSDDFWEEADHFKLYK